jgi:hypothetical protein
MWMQHRMELIIDYIRQRRLSGPQLFEALHYKLDRRVCFPLVSLAFSIEIILPAELCTPDVDSSSNRNEYQE